jgi:hypothetical protein
VRRKKWNVSVMMVMCRMEGEGGCGAIVGRRVREEEYLEVDEIEC